MTDTVNIGESWVTAETFCFDQTAQYLQTKPDAECFQGFEPEPTFDFWMLTSGGLGVGDTGRFYGESACWSTIGINARYVIVNENRLEAMRMAYKILAMLSEKDNFRSQSNIQEFRIADLPQEPEPIEVQQEGRPTGRIMWRIVLPMTMVFATGKAFT